MSTATYANSNAVTEATATVDTERTFPPFQDLNFERNSSVRLNWSATYINAPRLLPSSTGLVVVIASNGFIIPWSR